MEAKVGATQQRRSSEDKAHVNNVTENQIPKQGTLFKIRALSFPLSINVLFPRTPPSLLPLVTSYSSFKTQLR